VVTIRIEALDVALGDRRVLAGIDTEMTGGGLIGVIGPNGAGKSTLARAMLGLLKPLAGRVLLDGAEVGTLRPADRARTIAYLPQRHILHWDLSLFQTVSLGRLPHVAGMDRLTQADRDAIRRAMETAEISGFAERQAGTLSGGELARGMLARALAVEAPFLFADEPIAALDPYHAIHIMQLLRELARSGRSVLVVLHDLTLALRFCDRLLLMQGGRVVAEGPPQEVLAPAQLEATYRVEAEYGLRDGEPYIVPWRRLGGLH